MSTQDKTKAVLQEALAELFRRQTAGASVRQNTGSYILAQDGQFLGNITKNKFDQKSILNVFGPHGSKFSPTSIFNKFSNYASGFGQYSMNNPYSAKPPQLFINGKLSRFITKNRNIKNGVDPEIFVNVLREDVDAVLKGNFETEITNSPVSTKDAYIVAGDGAYLGSLDPNQYAADSIFNSYGPNGSEYSGTSIFNKYGAYGSAYSSLSPFNEFTSTPPKIMKGKRMVAWLTKNRFLNPRVDPDLIKIYAKKNA